MHILLNIFLPLSAAFWRGVINLRVRRMNHSLVLKFFLLVNTFFELLCIWYNNWAVGFTVWGSIPDMARDFSHLQNV
jgi:hypothetical protein